MLGHSFLGTLKFDLPVGLLLTGLFYLCIRPLARLLPYPHREACSAICPVVALPSLRAILVVAVSVLVGAWTHIFWDGFTHANGWCVREFSAQTPALFVFGAYKITVWQILQHGSTVLGLAFLALTYWRYSHGRRFERQNSILNPLLCNLIWFFLVVPPAVLAIHDNLGVLTAHAGTPYLDEASYEFSYNATVAYVSAFLPLATLAGVVVSLLEYMLIPVSSAPVLSKPSLADSSPATASVLQPEAEEVLATLSSLRAAAKVSSGTVDSTVK